MMHRVKLLLTYDIKEHRKAEYYHYIVHEFLPRAQSLGLYLESVHETVYGNYPNRLVSFVARDVDTMARALHGDVWDSIETKLGEFVTDYEKRLVNFKRSFQFFLPRRKRQYG
jgi:hypothetical protein